MLLNRSGGHARFRPHALVALVLVSVVAGLAGCAGGEDYPESAEVTFTSACVAQPGATAAGCECLFREVEERLSYEEFRRVDTAILIGEEIEGDERRAVLDALGACRDLSAASGGEPDSPSGVSTASEGDGLREADEEAEAESYFGEGGVADCGAGDDPFLTSEQVKRRLEAAGYSVASLDPPPGAQMAVQAETPSGFLAVAILETPEAAADFLVANITSDSQMTCAGNRVYVGVGDGGVGNLPEDEFVDAMLTAEGRR
jgi:hypothetical protein